MRESASGSPAGTASEQSPNDTYGNGHEPPYSPGKRFAEGKQLLFGAELVRWCEYGTRRELGKLRLEALDPIHQLELVLAGEHPLASVEFSLRSCPWPVFRIGHGARISLIPLTAQLYRPGWSAIGCPR